MKEFPKKYLAKEVETKHQNAWFSSNIYSWSDKPEHNFRDVDVLDAPKNEAREAKCNEHAGKQNKHTQGWRQNFVIDTPPPTVSGVLHMGHIFSYTQADFIARYQRMSGRNVFYPMGFDDNGLPTERLVEKIHKKKAKDLPREEFKKLCYGVITEAESEFERLFKSVALSIDWNQKYQTISATSQRISQASFVDLYNKGLIYKQNAPVLWDTVDKTALAQADIVDKEMKSKENYIKFGLASAKNGEKQGEFEIMTTRPELLPACVAIMCDNSYADKYQGKYAICPLTGIYVPIIPDDKVDKEKGTGMVMCCTYGDETDIEWFRKHQEQYNLQSCVILNQYGKIGEHTLHPDYPSMINIEKTEDVGSLVHKKARTEVRKIILEALDRGGYLTKQVDIKHVVKCAERSGEPIEIIESPQWYIKIKDKKSELLNQVEKSTWYPEHMKIRIKQWIEGLSWDWCISRQRYFGVPIPAWVLHKGTEEISIIADFEDLPLDPSKVIPKNYTLIKQDGEQRQVEDSAGNRYILSAETDILDTWATSSVSPQLNSQPSNEEIGQAITTDGGKIGEYATEKSATRHQMLFPADLRPQAHEIIRTWAFYTIVKSHLHHGCIPWHNLMISGWCLASDKTKMSKSKGNVITPVELIENKGADAVRYWASTSRLGVDTAFSENLLKIGNKLVNKLFNASKFASIHLQKFEKELAEHNATAREDIASNIIHHPLDLWVMQNLHNAIKKATASFEAYEYANAREATEDFFWNIFCDNWLEMAKTRLYNEKGNASKEAVKSGVYTIYHTLNAVLHLFAPFIPHITEELFQTIFEEKFASAGSLHCLGTWPKISDYATDATHEARLGTEAVDILNIVRKSKAAQNLSMKAEVQKMVLTIEDGVFQTEAQQELWLADVRNVTNSKIIQLVNNRDISKNISFAVGNSGANIAGDVNNVSDDAVSNNTLNRGHKEDAIKTESGHIAVEILL